jgi:dTDP-4-amino-4,6-dideoxygalactose transaminase
MKIPFNRPYLCGKEQEYIGQAVCGGKLSGNGMFTQKCQSYFEEKYAFGKCLLTSSGTDALEMCAILLDLHAGDEVILPSFTFVSTAVPFLMHGAKLVFADSSPYSPNMEAEQIEALITPKTKAIVVMHYAGVACRMDEIMQLVQKHNLMLVEDAALAIDSFHNGKALGSFGHLAAFSFHETKNIISGEGGMLVVNDPSLQTRAEIIWEKGTNRAAFVRGEVDQYAWKDIGSSFLPSELTAAFLFAQLQHLEEIQIKRKKIWNDYHFWMQQLLASAPIIIPDIPDYATCNASLFYVLVNQKGKRNDLLNYLNAKGIQAVFHYLPLHQSDFYKKLHDGRMLPHAVNYAQSLLRLPFYIGLKEEEVHYMVKCIAEYMKSEK